jgi:hypothetical protein
LNSGEEPEWCHPSVQCSPVSGRLLQGESCRAGAWGCGLIVASDRMGRRWKHRTPGRRWLRADTEVVCSSTRDHAARCWDGSSRTTRPESSWWPADGAPNLAYGASAVFPCGVTPALADGWQAPAQEDAH